MADNNTFGWMAGDANALVAPHMEYLRKNRWIMDFAGMPQGLVSAAANAAMSLRLNCSKAERPKIQFEEAEVKRLNGSIYLAGKPKYEPLNITFYDSIKTADNSLAAPGSVMAEGIPTVSDVMEQWRELIYQPNRGDAFGSVGNYKGFAYLHMLGPVVIAPTASDEDPTFDMSDPSPDSAIIQSWLFQGLFPQNIQYGEVDYGSNDVQEITVTFRYDRALRVKAKPSVSA
jgi:hypothetical protein